MRNRITVIFFCIMLAVLAIVPAAIPDRYYSGREKRTLAQLPDFSIQRLFSGEYADELENYLSDQFPLRDQWVAVKTYLELGMGKKDVNSVYIGKDNYLLDKFQTYSDAQLESNVLALAALQEALAGEKISMMTMLVPVSAQVLTDKLPAFADVVSYQEICQKLSTGGVETIDILDTMKNHSAENIYYRTDHHWTSLGAYYAYCRWAKSCGIAPIPQDKWTKETLCSNFYGTTWNKVQLPTIPEEEITAWYINRKHEVSYNDGAYVTDSIYEESYLKKNDQYGVFLNSNQAKTVIQGGGSNGKLLLVKDSYGNCFAQFAVEAYAEVHVIDLRFFHEDLEMYAKENGITDVLVLYGIQNFVQDKNLGSMEKQ